MANEYLQRTPTSTGNNKVFTWSGWVKRNKFSNAYVGSQNLFRASGGSGGDCGWRFDYSTPADSLRVFLNGAASGNVQADGKSRDPGAWMHVMVAFNSTLEQDSARVRIYVNGALIPDNNTGYPAKNYATSWNETVTQYIGAHNGSTEFFHGEMCDVFVVDGQALTPDVFGYHKDGAGYISVGSAQATSFKRGQWVPKKPSAIKAAINAEGGFGVNGFYLPINDGSNMGADFHCEPNSIITLKGENNPQPRNGAPTTTDAYVSQLRSDPYAANLVLAVPGIELENTNTELVPNGTFDTDITGWTGYNSTPTWDSVNQRLAINASTEFDGAETSSGISVSANTKYTFKVDIHLGTAGGIRIQIRDSSNAAGTLPTVDIDTSGTHIVNFDSLSNTSVYIRLITSGGNTGTAYFDNISIKEAVAVRDYSADIKGSGSNKTLTANGDAGVALVPSYYGSALSFDGSDDYFTLPANTSDLLLGSSDFTIECWVNKTNSGQQDVYGLYQTANNRRSYLLLLTDTQTVFYLNETGSSGINATANVVTPLNQWTHIAAERYGSNLTLYINGVAGATNTTANFTAYNNTVDSFMIGASDYSLANGSEFTGYIQDLRVYKGVAKYKGGFDVPKPYTPVGMSTWRAVPDTTANNFTTMSPLVEARPSSGSNTNHASSIITFADGNLSLTNASSSGNAQKMIAFSSVGFSTGKWYYEEITGSNGRLCLTKGIQQLQYGLDAGAGAGVEALVRINASDGVISIANTAYYSTATPANLTAESFDTTNVMGVAIDASLGKNNLTVQFYKDGVGIATLTGIGATSPVEEWFPTKLPRSSGSADEAYFNFGQNPTFSGRVTAGTYTDANGKGLFKYEPPSGHLALCEDNLPTPAISDPGKHFKTVLWTGSASARGIVGVGFKPDLVWVKSRINPSTGIFNTLVDSVRGAPFALFSNSTDSEDAPGGVSSPASVHGGISSFDNDGFSIMSGSSDTFLNNSGTPYVAWCWKAGGAAVSNTDGTITSQVSANQDAGFSIVSFTKISGTQTVGHGLGKTPKFIITKQRDGSYGWWTYHESIGQSYLELNSTNAAISLTWGGTNNSSVFYINNSYAVAGQRVIAYCWTEIEGFSKFGSYIGNASADGPFVYCGFKPAWIMVKVTTATNSWVIYDSSRSSTNIVNNRLRADLSNVEDTHNGVDFLSNGFKLRDAGSSSTNATQTYIFAAFAESPFQTANAK